MVEKGDQLALGGWAAEWQKREGGHEVTASDVAAAIAFTKKVTARVVEIAI